MLQYKVVREKMVAHEAYAMGMLQAKMCHETSITGEKLELKDVLLKIGGEHVKVTRQREIKEQNIIRLQEDIHKSKLQIEGLNVAIPKIDKVQQSGNAYELSDAIKAIANEPRELALQNEVDLFNEKIDEEATLQAHRDELEGVFSKLTSLQIIGETQVSAGLAGDQNLKQSDDMAEYFDEVLTQQIDPETGLAYADDKMPGNSTRFKPDDEMTSYYRKVFVESFSPSIAQQEEQRKAHKTAEQIALANYYAVEKGADVILATATQSLLTSIYPVIKNSRGSKLDFTKGVEKTSTPYINAKAYIEEQISNPSDDTIATEIDNALSIMSASKAKTVVRDLKVSKDADGNVLNTKANTKAIYYRGLLEALGMKTEIGEIETEMAIANYHLKTTPMSVPGFSKPINVGSDQDPLDAIMQNLPD